MEPKCLCHSLSFCLQVSCNKSRMWWWLCNLIFWSQTLRGNQGNFIKLSVHFTLGKTPFFRKCLWLLFFPPPFLWLWIVNLLILHETTGGPWGVGCAFSLSGQVQGLLTSVPVGCFPCPRSLNARGPGCLLFLILHRLWWRGSLGNWSALAWWMLVAMLSAPTALAAQELDVGSGCNPCCWGRWGWAGEEICGSKTCGGQTREFYGWD